MRLPAGSGAALSKKSIIVIAHIIQQYRHYCHLLTDIVCKTMRPDLQRHAYFCILSIALVCAKNPRSR